MRHIGIALDEDELVKLKDLAEVRQTADPTRAFCLFPPEDVAEQVIAAQRQRDDAPLKVQTTQGNPTHREWHPCLPLSSFFPAQRMIPKGVSSPGCCFDCTYFESFSALKQPGYSKDAKLCQVLLALAVTETGLPVHFRAPPLKGWPLYSAFEIAKFEIIQAQILEQ